MTRNETHNEGCKIQKKNDGSYIYHISDYQPVNFNEDNCGYQLILQYCLNIHIFISIN